MLILSRKPHESIIINDNIHIEVLEWNSLLVKLGITAPRHVSVHREEIYRRIKRKNIQKLLRNHTVSHFNYCNL